MPLSSLALGYAKLAAAQAGSPDALARIRAAMVSHPELVSGTGRHDLAFMRAGGGDWVTKVGAEGVQGIGISSLGLGIAIKIADGNARGLHPACVAVLERLVGSSAAQSASGGAVNSTLPLWM